MNNVLTNPFIWGMALTYFFIYIVRQGVTSWFVFYLLKEKGVEDAAQAAVRVSGLELGGLMGSLIAGKGMRVEGVGDEPYFHAPAVHALTLNP